MSFTDKGKPSNISNEDLAKNLADSTGKISEKITELTTPFSDTVYKAQQLADKVRNGIPEIEQKYSDVLDSDFFQSANNFITVPSEVLEKEMLQKALTTYGGDLANQLKNSHIVYSVIQIDGKDVLKDTHFTLEINQKMADHDSFLITCYADAFGDRNAYPMASSRKMLGKRTTIQFKQFGKTAYLFTGIITEITNKKIDGQNKIFLTGKAPTILLENGQDCQSFEQLGLKDIITQATSEYPQDLVSWDLRPRMQDPLLYTVQYRESDWEFVKRLATRYGEWLFYNGQQIVFGASGGKTEELVEEQDIYDFELKMKLVPQKFTYIGYDAKQAKDHTVNSDDIPLTRRLVNPFQQHAIQASEEIYSKVPLSLYNQSLLEKGEYELRQAVERQKLNRQNVFFVEAKTNNPNLRLGDIIKMKAWMPGHEIFKNGEVPLESYIITQISHHQDITEGYYNRLVGIPMDNTVPNYMDEDAIPECEDQSAVVMDNNDPEGMSRIRVQFPWQKPFGGMTPWIRSITPYAGGGKGMHVVPEIGEEVIVSFENGNAEKPVSLGAMFNGQGKSGHGGAGNYVKGLQTPTGNKIQFNDEEGSALLTDNGGVNMKFDGNGNAVTAAQNSTLVAVGGGTEEKPEPQSLLHMDEEGKIYLEGKKSLTIVVGKSSFMMEENGTISFNGLDFILNAGNNISLNAIPVEEGGAATVVIAATGGDISLENDQNINIKGGIEVKIT